MPLPPSVVDWINQEVAKERREGFTPGSPRETEILTFWRTHRPKMYAALMEQGLATKLAFVLDMKRYQEMVRYLKAGMPPTDAEEQARKEWLLMEAENESHKPPLLDQISTLMTPRV